VDLVRQGWIGTHGVTTDAIQLLVDAAVRERHSLILAEDLGEQAGSERRAPRQRIE
jgi:hypothetical protein